MTRKATRGGRILQEAPGTADFELRTAEGDCGLRIANCGFRIADFFQSPHRPHLRGSLPRVPVSPCPRFPVSLCPRVPASPRLRVSASPHHPRVPAARVHVSDSTAPVCYLYSFGQTAQFQHR
jgi:hypothetical protein